ncbi:uncharacterized protein LOC100875650 isoform X2 [Megachile rotundata]|uniref:uncharacterized protein LOC100875650 isoform X2 n=1 Tax=Megachile rotundata TaxID=143995 RepID=UPI000258EF8C|nr:PREDICTED: uncharacterized protein LOC100875650 isoform X2 [Megachile rotundata]
MRNIEIKAKITNLSYTVSRIKQLTDTYCTVIKQHDTFFKVAEGRLKLRRFENGSGELIYYKRSNILGPKLCNYEKAALEANACVEIKNILSASNGCIGTVEKTRQLYMVGQTRIHVDDVEGLGNFLELEVVLTKEDDEYKGEKIAQDLMNKLGVKIQDLISEAYIDLLSKTTV